LWLLWAKVREGGALAAEDRRRRVDSVEEEAAVEEEGVVVLNFEGARMDGVVECGRWKGIRDGTGGDGARVPRRHKINGLMR
jgi:hypothetical protein